MRWKLFSLTTLLLSLFAFTSVSPAQETKKSRPPLGLNLAGVRDYSSEIVFVDAFKAARSWISQAKGKPWGKGGPLEVDEKGNVQSLRPGQYAETIVFTGFEDRFPAGVFTCLYDGEGEIDLAFDAKVIERQPGKLKVKIQPRNGMASLRIMKTNPKNPVRNIRLIIPGFEETYEKQPFHPDFLKRWQGFKAFRFMDWMRTNCSQVAEWSDRPTPDMHSQALRGVALEYMIQLCNTMDVEPWFCMPHKATDDYVRKFAQMVKAQLKPSLKVYIEYSNECWNGQFEQARYCAEQGKKLGLSNNGYEAQIRFYSQRSVEIFNIWQEVFGDNNRLVRVLAMQSANPWTGQTAMDWKKAYEHADAIAIAPYFGHRWGSPKTADKVAAMTVDELMKKLPADLDKSRENMEAYAAAAKKRGLKLFAYEGGQHLVGNRGAENNKKLTELFHAANRHPAMKDLYLQNLRDWDQAGGDLFCVFSSIGRYNKWGSWGLLEYPGQDPKLTPKFLAIQEYLGRSQP